jgi:hypothetical protein
VCTGGYREWRRGGAGFERARSCDTHGGTSSAWPVSELQGKGPVRARHLHENASLTTLIIYHNTKSLREFIDIRPLHPDVTGIHVFNAKLVQQILTCILKYAQSQRRTSFLAADSMGTASPLAIHVEAETRAAIRWGTLTPCPHPDPRFLLLVSLLYPH